ncbi:threonine aldolase family protein [Clostridium sp.]|uniref:threonine aldolase family protein n=1 Tax=Clostridium sp. TaxID=1506 RepID=UPI003F312D80
MYSFKNDYSEGAHPQILESLVKSNLNQQDGYGEDEFCLKAKGLIREKAKNENIDVHFISGGTQTNLISIAAFLRPYEGCISANTGHIFVNETGAIECTGHKVITVNSSNGKITGKDVASVLEKHNSEHVVKPKLVYISNSTEIGTIYKKRELEELSKVCRENNLILFMDGARLGSALSCRENDLTLEDICKLTDAFYIGGTKNGALLGEALVISNDSLKENFRYHLKQRGALLAKGRILGIQVMELFREDLFLKIGKHMNLMADILRDGISKEGYEFLVESPSNQVFPILQNNIIKKLQEDFSFIIWEKIDESNSAIRLVTSWATKKEDVEKFVFKLKEL